MSLMNKTKMELIGMINEANTRIEALERDILLFSKNPKTQPQTNPTKSTIQKRTFEYYVGQKLKPITIKSIKE